MAKYYRVKRFLKIQKIEDSNKDKVEPDWVEVNEDGSSIEKPSNKKKSKKEVI